MAIKDSSKRAVNDRANESAKKAKQMPEGVQYAITVALPHISNGAFWGFTTMQSIRDHMQAIREAAPKITARQLGNSCLLEIDPTYLIRAVQQIDPNAMTQQDIQDIQRAMAEAHVAFEKFLVNKGKGVVKTAQAFTGTIGIYCVNDVTTISSKGVNYPAFRLNLQDALRYLHQYGFKVKVNGQYIYAKDALNAGQAMWSSLGLAPTKTGVFMDITSYYTPEQYMSLEKSFKNNMRIMHANGVR